MTPHASNWPTAIDPNAAKRQARIEASIRAGNTFASVAKELIEKKEREGRAAKTMEKQRWLLKLLGADFGKRPVADITPQELLHELKKHERRGRLETAKQLRAFAGQVFRYAAATKPQEMHDVEIPITAAPMLRPCGRGNAPMAKPNSASPPGQYWPARWRAPWR